MLKKRLGIEAIEGDWYSDEKLINYFKILTSLIIPEGCERIGQYAFDEYDKLEKVVIPVSCWNIGPYAFYDCLRATIILEKPVKKFKIGYGAFCNVKYVKEEIRS